MTLEHILEDIYEYSYVYIYEYTSAHFYLSIFSLLVESRSAVLIETL